MKALAALLEARRALVEDGLDRFLPEPKGPAEELHDAMRAAVLSSGKRLRPILVIEAAALLKKPPEHVAPLAAAVEFVHAASLALDDLPAMDDAKLRRGQPALHVRVGEGLTILAAVALLMHAQEILVRAAFAAPRLKSAAREELLTLAAATVGPDGMAAGQWADLSRLREGATLQTIEFVHRRKTGRLFELCLRGAALLCNANAAETAALDAYGKNLGLAFQVKDDLLDAEGTVETLGKDAGKDLGKATFVDLAGTKRARVLVDDLLRTATAALDIFGRRADPLRALAEFVRDREA